MKVLITGKTGVGKTSILRQIGFANTLYVDDLVKDNFYLQGHPLFDKVVNMFGWDIVENAKINTKALGKKVLHDKAKLQALSLLVIPYIKSFITKLNGNWLIEMAIYMNHVKAFAGVFDKVVLVKRQATKITNKFDYALGIDILTIPEDIADFDLCIENDAEIENAAHQLNLYLKGVFE